MRKHILTSVSADAAGILQASYRLTEVTVAVITAGASLYAIPQLGALTGDKHALQEKVRYIVSSIALISVLLGIIVFLLRKPIIYIIFNEKFSGVADLMLLQTIFLPLKATVIACGYVLVSEMRQKWYIATQLIGPVIFATGVMQLEFPGSISRVIVASCIASAIQLLFALYAIRDLLIPPEKYFGR